MHFRLRAQYLQKGSRYKTWVLEKGSRGTWSVHRHQGPQWFRTTQQNFRVFLTYEYYTCHSFICKECARILYMRTGFEDNLRKYGQALKDSFKNLSGEGKKAAEETKQQLTSEAAQQFRTDIESEGAIYKIQKQKQERMNKFKRLLEKTRAADGSFVHPEIKKDLPVVIQLEDGSFVVDRPGAGQAKVTLGDIMTDHEWGIEYTFDHSVNIHTVRNYYLEQLKSDLGQDLDEQIIISETKSSQVLASKKEAYESIQKRLDTDDLEQRGVIAEKMVKNFLRKMTIDGHADFEIIDADVYQDVENKADFIIRRKNLDRTKGAKVIETEDEEVMLPIFEDVGIQFTINTDTEKQEIKERQVARSKMHLENMQDLVLVTMPSYNAGKVYRRWNKTKTPGGPEKRWSNETKEAIFRGVLSKVLTSEEIDEFCKENFHTKE